MTSVLAAVLFVLTLVVSCEGLKVLTNRKTGVAEMLGSKIDHLEQWTICGRFRNAYLTPTEDPWQQIIYKAPLWMLARLELRQDVC